MSVINPVLGREVRERLRSGRAYVSLTLFLGLLTLLTWVVAAATTRTNQLGGPNIGQITSSGRSVLDALVIGMTVLMVFLLPGIAATAVTGERERQTLIPLQISMLRPRSILIGKVLSAAAYAALMLTAALPLFAAAYLLGGVSAIDTIRTLLALIFVAALITTFCVAWSTVVRRSAAAVVVSYAFTLLLFIGAPLLYAASGVFVGANNNPGSRPNAKRMMLVNPVVAVALLQAPGDKTLAGGGVLGGLRTSMRQGQFDNFGQRQQSVTSVAGIPDWIVSAGSLGLFAIGAGMIGVRRLRTPTKSER
jgi:ABC-type transport system involved in multi-copper enzyme maturation permease subunit